MTMIAVAMNSKKVMSSTLMVVALLFAAPSFAQELKNAPYYINMNAGNTRTYEIPNESLSIQYHDAYGKWKEIPFRIYDWKRNVVATLNLDKGLGLNNYVIDLKSVYNGWKSDEVYTVETKDESGRLYTLPIRLVPPPEELKPLVEIVVSPEQVGCDGIAYNLVKFYGVIKGGKAPYNVSWFVLNSKRTDFLYQPREEVIEKPGKTMAVTVDQSPDYYVVLQVKDACGNIGESIVNLVCEAGRKKINTIFIEELKSPLVKQRSGN